MNKCFFDLEETAKMSMLNQNLFKICLFSKYEAKGTAIKILSEKMGTSDE